MQTPPPEQPLDQDLRESLSFVVEQTTDSVYITDTRGRIQYVNPAFERITGYSSGEVLGKNPRLLKSGKQPQGYYDTLWKTILAGRVFSGRIINRRKNGELIHELKTISAVRNEAGEITGFMCVDSDITKQITLEQELLTIAEREQRRIGLEFHDNLGQTLTGIAFLSQALTRDLEAKSLEEAARAKQITTLANDAVERSRHLSRGLFPIELETGGVETALRDLAASMESVFGIACTTSIRIKAPLKISSAPIYLYRIAQESCLNAIKHGGAKRIKILLSVTDRQIKLSVGDDGSGLPHSADYFKGLGMESIKYRSNILNGQVSIRRSSMNGMEVVFSGPNLPS